MEKFYLEIDEDFFTVIDRIKRSRDNRIVLIVPGGFSALRSIINLRILKEESISLDKDVAIITSDSLIKKLAQQVNLTVADRIREDARQNEWENKRQREFDSKFKQGKKIISDIVRGPKPERSAPTRKAEQKFEETTYESIEDFSAGEELRDLGDKEEQFDELFVKKRKEEKKYEKEKEPEIYFPEKEKISFKFFTFKRLILLLIALLLVGGGFFLYFVLPRAEISIKTKKEPVNFETEITADKNAGAVNKENGIIPAQAFQIEVEDSRTFPSTGEKDVSEKARGTITIYNQYSSSEQTLVKTTRLRSESGKIFRLTDTVIIPGATIEEGKIVPNSRDVYVEADEAGEAYNISSSKFTIPGLEGTPKYIGFYGESKSAMTGGAKGKMKVATQGDIDGATQIVSLELTNKAKEEFIKKIPAELKLLESSQILEVVESTSSLKADQPGKEFTIMVKARAWGMAFKEEDVIAIVEESIGSKISADKFLIPVTIKITYGKSKIDINQSKAIFSCQVEAEAGWNIDENKLKNDLAGKNEIDVRQYLSSLAEVDVARVVFWPFWVKKIPSNKDKIKIIIEGKQ
jgi:hypothetical protein